MNSIKNEIERRGLSREIDKWDRSIVKAVVGVDAAAATCTSKYHLGILSEEAARAGLPPGALAAAVGYQ